MTQCLILSLLFLLFPLISYGKPQQTNSQLPCKCQRWQDCTWSQNLFNQIAVLPKDHQNYKPFLEQFKAQICDQKTRHVWCCGGFEKDLTIGPRFMDFELESHNDSHLWKPNGFKEECGQADIALEHITGGEIAKYSEFRWSALLGFDHFSNGEIYYTCGGSLINKWYVLTAAHCVHNREKNLREVVLGEHTVGTDPDCPKCAKKITRGIDKIFIHEDFNGIDSKNDIALIKLTNSVPLFSDYQAKSSVTPICLPWNEDNFARSLNDNARAVVSGWGKTFDYSRELTIKILETFNLFSKKLRKLKVNIANNKCTELGIVVDPTMQLCAGGYKGEGICEGDSGAPLVAREFSDDPYYQIGVASFGTSQCGQIGVPGIYTKVTAYLPWIESKMKL